MRERCVGRTAVTPRRSLPEPHPRRRGNGRKLPPEPRVRAAKW
ncbi:hypothetical protein AZ78_4606 [Lysobacter capsici AZ78]|uniref:Uncharacterized protein n=1 Tax=Lysobacter capsici AZ78 TaxID=1444315 RepID=A0A108UD31_9GAMM|nr:hypothetical protein AZ78_4606 [Lysobacter capsici AZ78]